MGMDYKLVSVKTKENFNLGRGPWWELFSGGKKFSMTESKDDFKILVEVALKEKDYTPEESHVIADKIWDWCQGKELYFGNDCDGVFDENREEIDYHETKETGTRYG